MAEITMSEDDWNAALAEWNESIQYLYMSDSLAVDLASILEVKVPESFTLTEDEIPKHLNTIPKKKEAGRYIKYVKIGAKGTAKAKFFITESGTPIRGFWCPKAAIITDLGDKVFVANWCKVKTITFD